MRVSSVIKLTVLALAAAGILILVKFFHVQDLLGASLQRIRDMGPAGIGIFVLIYILSCVLFLPGAVLTLGAGAIYGVVKGSIVVSISATLGATAAFLVGRYGARAFVEGKIEGNRNFKAIDDAVARDGWKIVGLTRLSPIFPFNLLNYAYGVTKVSLRDYFLASWIGMLPGTVMYVYIGSLAGDAARAASGMPLAPDERTAKIQWAIRILGLCATVAAAVFAAKTAKKALNQKVPG